MKGLVLPIFEMCFFIGVGAGTDEIDVILSVFVSTSMSKSATGFSSLKMPMATHSVEHGTVIQQPNGYVQLVTF